MSLLGNLDSDLKIPSEYLMDPLLLKPSLHLVFDTKITKLHENLLKNLEKDLPCTLAIPSLPLENTLLKDEPSTVMPFPIEPADSETQTTHIVKSRQKLKPSTVRRLKKCKPTQRLPKFNKIQRKRSVTGLRDLRHKVAKKKRKESVSEHLSNEYEDLFFDEGMNEDDDDDDYERDNKKDDYFQKLKFTQEQSEPETNMESSIGNIQQLKEKLLRVIGAVLISSPKFKSSDCEKKIYIENLCSKIANVDPEFILKVALYSRLQLNIRSASNYLLAFASMHPECRNFLKKYYRKTVVLPSDWIEVAEFCAYQTVNKPDIIGVLPTALRKVMVEKFNDFDEYQLAKYNKDKKGKNSDKDKEDEGNKGNMDEYPDKTTRCEMHKISGTKMYTLKQLVRQLHISKPVKHVMCLIGKKYPATLEQFYLSRLDGTFDESKAAKRMKLAVPETWETQISLHGNSASVWESLIDHKKLPYMAMLRNIRNLIKAEISSKHTAMVFRKLSDENNVIHSKQLPTQFFSAYAVLEQMEKELNGESEAKSFPRKRKPNLINYTQENLDAYKATLDKAMKFATNHNLRPIKGRTVIFCNLVNESGKKNVCKTAKGFGKLWTKRHVSVLLAVMCNYSCESCQIVLWQENYKHFVVDVKPGTILQNVIELVKMIDEEILSPSDCSHNTIVGEFFNAKLETREQIDNFIMVDDCPLPEFDNFKTVYRLHVNPNMLFVKVTLSDGNRSTSLIDNEMSSTGLTKDIEIAGFSDQILTFIDTCGDSGQLLHVENIDKEYHLKAIVPLRIPKRLKTSPLQGSESIPDDKWKTVQVFISSTFHDMHGERDILTRYVFPKLKHWAKKYFIRINEVDLRWGIPEQEAESSSNLSICLAEVSNSDLFIGILGERYGWVPSKENIPANPDFDWVREYEGEPSITELEMHIAALSRPDAKKKTAFFYIRNDNFSLKVPKKWMKYFVAENSDKQAKMDSLKDRIKRSGFDVCNGYPAEWGGIKDGVPFASGLEHFAKRVFHQLQNAVKSLYIDKQPATKDAVKTQMKNLHQAFVEKQEALFIGRKSLLENCLSKIKQMSSGVLLIEGKAGCGKTAFLCKLVHECISKQYAEAPNVLVNITGIAPDSTNIMLVLKRFCYQMKNSNNLETPVPKEYKNILKTFSQMLHQCHHLTNGKILVFIDGLDLFDNIYQPQNLTWLSEIPEGVIFILSVENSGQYRKNLVRRNDVCSFVMPGLVMTERLQIIRNALGAYRKALNESFFNNQLKVLAWKKEASNPFFLQIACEEMRVFGVFKKVTEKVASLPETTQSLLENILERLEEEIGKDIIKHALCLLLCSKNGLLTSELYDLLNLCMVIKNDSKEDKFHMDFSNPLLLQNLANSQEFIPKHKSVRLHYVLHCFLNFGETYTKSGSLSINYKLLRTAIQNRYLETESAKYYHQILSCYYYQKADCCLDGSWIGKEKHVLAVLPFHLISAELFSELKNILTNLNFVHSMCMLGLGSILLEYYSPCFIESKNMEKLYNAVLSDPEVKDFKVFLKTNLHILNKCPSLTWQQAINGLPSSSVHKKAIGIEKMVYVHWNNRPTVKDPCNLLIDDLPEKPTCVALSSDNTLLACGCEDGVVHLFDAQTGNELRNFIGHSDRISSVCFVGTNQLCSASFDSNLCLWDIKDGFRVYLMKGHTRKVSCCCSDSTQRLIASSSWDTTVKIWNASKGSVVCSFTMKRPVNCVAFHPEKELIVAGLWDATLHIWDFNRKSEVAIIRGHMSSVRAVAYLPTGTYITSASLDGSVKIWSADHGKQIGSIMGHAGPVNAIAYTSNGKEMVTVGEDGKVKIWSSYLGKLIHTLKGKECDAATCVSISPSVTHITVGYHSGKVRIFHITTGEKLHEYQMHTKSICSIRYSPDEKFILTGSSDTTAKMFFWTNGHCKHSFTKHSQPLLCADICSKFVVTTAEDASCYLYSLKNYSSDKSSSVTQLRQHDAPISACTFSFDEVFLVTAGRDKKIVIWDLNKIWQPHRILYDCHKDWITDCKMSQCGKFLVTCSNDFLVKVWDTRNGTLASTMTGHMAPINAVSYRKQCVTSACSDGSVKIWSDKGFEVTTLFGHSNRVNDCDMRLQNEDIDLTAARKSWADVAEDKKTPVLKKDRSVTLATCSDDGLVNIWQPLTLKENFCLRGHSDQVLDVSCTNKGVISSCSRDGSLRVWSVPSGSEKPTVDDDHNTTITGIIYSPVTEMIITSSRDGTVKFWNANNVTHPRCVTTIKLSDSSINCMCIYDVKATMFATGMDDRTIKVWQIVPQKGTYSVKKLKEFSLDMPIIGMECWPTSQQQTMLDVLISYTRKSTLTVLTLSTERDVTDPAEEVSSKFSSFKFKNKVVITTIADGRSVLLWGITKTEGQTSPILEKTEEADWLLSPETVLTAVFMTEKFTFFGDSSGQIHWTQNKVDGEGDKDENNGKTFTARQNVAIDCLLVVDEIIVSASADNVLRVWNMDMEQIAQFYCLAPVTNMTFCKRTQTGDIHFAVGDQLGKLYFLTLKF